MKELVRIYSQSGYIMRKWKEEKSMKNKMTLEWDNHEYIFKYFSQAKRNREIILDTLSGFSYKGLVI